MLQQKPLAFFSTHGYVDTDLHMDYPDTGGQVTYVMKLAEACADLGYPVDVFTRQFENLPPEKTVYEAQNAAVRIIRINTGDQDFVTKEKIYPLMGVAYNDDFQGGAFVSSALTTMAALNANYQLAYSHYADGGLAAQLIANQLNMPHFHNPHSVGEAKFRRTTAGMGPVEVQRTMKEHSFGIRIKAENFVYKSANGLVSTCQEMTDWMTGAPSVYENNHCPYDFNTPMTEIAAGVDAKAFDPQNRSKIKANKTKILTSFGLPDNIQGPILGVCGRLVETKGYDLAIDAFKFATKNGLQANLVIATGGPNEKNDYLEQLKKQAGELYNASIFFIPSVPSSNVQDFYMSVDAMTMPSKNEALGMVGLEAMTSGAPTILTTHSGLAKIPGIDSYATCVDPHDTQSFANNMAYMLNNIPEHEEISAKGREFLQHNFSWHGKAQNHLGFFEQHLNR